MTGNDAYKVRTQLGFTRQELATELKVNVERVISNEFRQKTKVDSMYQTALKNYAKTERATKLSNAKKAKMTGADAYKLRIQLGLTQKKLATKLRVSIGVVIRNEHPPQAKINPTYQSALKNYARTKGKIK